MYVKNSHEVRDALAFDDGRDAGAVALVEALRVPDLDVVEAAGDDDVTLEPGVLAQVLRHGDAPLLVRSDLHGTREEGAGGLAWVPRSRASRSFRATRSNSLDG